MKFKKDDMVEVIDGDKWEGRYYPVGTQLRVCEDQGHNYSTVRVYDSMQKGGCAKLWEWNLKLIKRPEEPQEQKEMRVKAFDLNNLTTSELREYVELVEYKENAEFLLECFIEKVSK